MTLDQLRIFVAVAEREHVTQAAKVLNLSQSAVSSAIFLLEGNYGLKLFHRVGRGIVLTEAGKFFLGEARAILARTQSAEIALGEFVSLARGRLTIHASQTISSYFLPAHLVQFHLRFPGIQLAVAVGNTAQVVRAVTQGEAELGFIEGPAPDPMLAAELVGTDEMIIVVAPGHPWENKKHLSASDLTSQDWVLREAGSGTRAVFTEAMSALGVGPEDLRVAIALPSNEAVRAAVEAGLGATALSSLVCTDSLAAGKLVRLETRLPRREFNAVQHVERYRSRTVAALLALIHGAENSSETG